MIKLVLAQEYGDGFADYSFEYSDEFIAYYKQETGAKIVRKANVGKFIQKLITQAFNEPTPKSK